MRRTQPQHWLVASFEGHLYADFSLHHKSMLESHFTLFTFIIISSSVPERYKQGFNGRKWELKPQLCQEHTARLPCSAKQSLQFLCRGSEVAVVAGEPFTSTWPQQHVAPTSERRLEPLQLHPGRPSLTGAPPQLTAVLWESLSVEDGHAVPAS